MLTSVVRPILPYSSNQESTNFSQGNKKRVLSEHNSSPPVNPGLLDFITSESFQYQKVVGVDQLRETPFCIVSQNDRGTFTTSLPFKKKDKKKVPDLFSYI